MGINMHWHSCDNCKWTKYDRERIHICPECGSTEIYHDLELDEPELSKCKNSYYCDDHLEERG